MDPSDFEDDKDWFRYSRGCGQDAASEGQPRSAPFKDFDACEEFYAGYDSAAPAAATDDEGGWDEAERSGNRNVRRPEPR